MAVQSVRQEARRQVQEAAASRMRLMAEREARLNELAVDLVTAIAARDRAELDAAEAVGVLLGEQVTLAETGQRCGLAVKDVRRLKRIRLDAEAQGYADKSQGDDLPPGGDERS